MVTEIYDALRDAQGVSDEKARKAAEAVAAFDQRFVTVERRLDETKAAPERKIDETKSGIELKIEEVKGSLRVMQWMLVTIVAGMAALLVRTFA